MRKKEDYLMIDILHKRGVEQAELRAAEIEADRVANRL